MTLSDILSIILTIIFSFFSFTAGDGYPVTEIPAEKFPIETADPETPDLQKADVYVEGDDVLCFKTHDYFGGGASSTFLIKNKKELSEFYAAYGEKAELKKFVKGIDFSETVLAYEMITLTSGSISCDLKGAAVSNGKVKFDYTMNYPEIGTCDMAMIYLFAKIPKEAL